MAAIFTNGKVSISKPPIGLAVLVDNDDGHPDWVPLLLLNKEELAQVEQLLDHNPTFPWYDELRELRDKVYELHTHDMDA